MATVTLTPFWVCNGKRPPQFQKRIKVSFPYHLTRVKLVEAIEGCIWDPHKLIWTIPGTFPALRQLFRNFNGYHIRLDKALAGLTDEKGESYAWAVYNHDPESEE